MLYIEQGLFKIEWTDHVIISLSAMLYFHQLNSREKSTTIDKLLFRHDNFFVVGRSNLNDSKVY